MERVGQVYAFNECKDGKPLGVNGAGITIKNALKKEGYKLKSELGGSYLIFDSKTNEYLGQSINFPKQIERDGKLIKVLRPAVITSDSNLENFLKGLELLDAKRI